MYYGACHTGRDEPIYASFVVLYYMLLLYVTFVEGKNLETYFWYRCPQVVVTVLYHPANATGVSTKEVKNF